MPDTYYIGQSPHDSDLPHRYCKRFHMFAKETPDIYSHITYLGVKKDMAQRPLLNPLPQSAAIVDFEKRKSRFDHC
jgi:hypothetical protein